MKKNQYAIAIAIGVVIGAVAAVLSGNGLTGLLVGMLVAFGVTGALSLRWEKSRALACLVDRQVRQAFSRLRISYGQSAAAVTSTFRPWIEEIRDHKKPLWERLLIAGIPLWAPLAIAFPVAATMCLVAVAIVALALVAMYWSVYAIYYCILRPLVMIPYLIVTDELVRKAFYYHLALMLLSASIVTISILLIERFNSYALPSELSEFCFPGIFFGAVIFAFSAAFFLFPVYSYTQSGRRDHLEERFKDDLIPGLEWFKIGMNDGRTPLRSVAYMLLIRTINALSPVIWVALFVFWLPLGLANRKTGLSAMTASILVAIDWIVCHSFGWVELSEVNFWLLATLAAVIGFAAGRPIYRLELRIPARPRFTVFSLLEHTRV